MKTVSICFLFYLLLTSLTTPTGLASPLQPNQGNSLAGNWIITTTGNADGRRVNFEIKRGQLGGTYFTSTGQAVSITNIGFTKGTLNFKIPVLGLYFQMRMVRDSFEGRVISYKTQKAAPEAVKMTRDRR